MAGRHLISPGYRAAAWTLKPPLHLLMRTVRDGWENLPPAGTGYIAAANHISNIDFLPIVEFFYDTGAPGRVLVKDSLWKVPLVRQLLNATGQIPVRRGTARAGDALAEARKALASGTSIIMYPEGTITKDPTMWPMAARPGVGRLALSTGVPVVPIGQWGAHEVLPRTGRFPRPLPRHTEHIRVGPAVNLDDLMGRTDPGAAREATDRIMKAVTAIVGELRGAIPPDRPYNPYGAGDTR
ncbi:MAG: 1-acyl-sn-glycerol-3-phosphate acyltransferase [Bifidobacteriaceae bacterium]|jgi:1-acyl-sn-glycerol-3-phosphate acyltransferase|nr:1-acyl-sn-glycerol-3-phosphate acyltransferase [Bifidobacteriaceae bacterium]